MHSSSSVVDLLVGVALFSSILSICPHAADSAPAAASAAAERTVPAVDLEEVSEGVRAGSDSDEAELGLENLSVDQLLHLVHSVLKMRRHGLFSKMLCVYCFIIFPR